MPQVIARFHHVAAHLVAGHLAPLRGSLQFCLHALPLLAEVGLRQDEAVPLEGLLLLLGKLGLQALPDPRCVGVADGLDDQLEGDSFLCAEGEALVDEYVDCDAGVQTDGEGDSIEVLAFMVEVLTDHIGQVLSQLVVTLPLLVPLQSLGQGE